MIRIGDRHVPVLAALRVVLSASVALANPVSFQTAAGTIELPALPHQIIARHVAAIDTLSALGVVPTGVVAPLYVGYLDDIVSNPTIVATLFESDFGKPAALQPDLIVVGGRSVSQAKAKVLADELLAKVERGKTQVSTQSSALILMTNGPKLSVFGAQSRFGWLHTTLGWPQVPGKVRPSAFFWRSISFPARRCGSRWVSQPLPRLSAPWACCF